MSNAPELVAEVACCLLEYKEMKGLLWLAALVLPSGLQATTLLYSHTGSANPTTEGWIRTATTTVVGEAFDDEGRDVWRVYDPGLSTGGTSLTYSAVMNATLATSVMATGWDLSTTLSVPTDDPTIGNAIGTDSNAWVGLIVNETPTNRRVWALMFGRAANGDTLVAAYGVTGTRTLAPGYHDYSLLYDPVTALATISIDGEVWKTYAGLSLAGNGSQQVYWGDNNGQSTVITPRAIYYESIQFSTVPEPSRLLLLGMSGGAGLFRRRRGR